MQKLKEHVCAARQDDALQLLILFYFLLLDCAKENTQMFL
jgi:hypothetical protein